MDYTLKHRICEICGKEFDSYNPYPRYCSLHCKTVGQMVVVDCRQAILLYESGHSQEEVASLLGVSQQVISSLFKRNGHKSRRAIKRNQFGENNASWKGDDATYSALHFRVESRRGKPNKCDVCGQDDPTMRYNWANLTGVYTDIWDYKRMCVKCHRRFDKTRKNSSSHVKRNA